MGRREGRIRIVCPGLAPPRAVGHRAVRVRARRVLEAVQSSPQVCLSQCKASRHKRTIQHKHAHFLHRKLLPLTCSLASPTSHRGRGKGYGAQSCCCQGSSCIRPRPAAAWERTERGGAERYFSPTVRVCGFGVRQTQQEPRTFPSDYSGGTQACGSRKVIAESPPQHRQQTSGKSSLHRRRKDAYIVRVRVVFRPVVVICSMGGVRCWRVSASRHWTDKASRIMFSKHLILPF